MTGSAGAAGAARAQPPAGMSGSVAAALGAALQAGRAVMGVYATDFGSRPKEDGSPLTEADLASDRIIAGALAETGIPVLSEEGEAPAAGGGGPEGRTWIVDPLDGTADFVGRTGEFTVMIALARGGRPVAGVINCPAADGGRGIVYAAESGRGAFRLRAGEAWERIAASGTGALRGATAVVSRNHLTCRERGMLDSLGISRREGVGSSLKACRIAEGSADVYLTYTDRMHVWDTAASECILAEAGGAMTDMEGAPLRYGGPGTRHGRGVLATNGPLHAAVLRQARASAESP